MNDESGITLKIIAGVIGLVLVLCAGVVLKTDPIREQGPERHQAIEQVKTFATFIKTRPEMAHDPARSVLTMVKTRMNPETQKTTNQDFDLELSRRLGEPVADPALHEAFLRAHQEEVYRYLAQAMSVEDLKRDTQWEQNIKLMLTVVKDKEFKPEIKNQTLDLLSQQLLEARGDAQVLVRHHTDEWFEEYLRAETRPAQRLNMVAVYQEKVIQAGRQFQDSVESPPVEPSVSPDL